MWLNRILGGLGRTLIFAGIVLLLFVAFQLWGTALSESADQEELTQEFGDALLTEAQTEDLGSDDGEGISAETIKETLKEVDPADTEGFIVPEEGSPGGFIEIPKIALRSKAFVEGVAKADLQRGPGHYPGTPFPGQPGNSGIAGHRSTYGAPFNRLDELEPGDDVVMYTPQGEFTYKVVAPPDGLGIERGLGWYTVAPNDVTVLEDFGDNRITLTACHPKYSAKQRIIVHAVLDETPAPESEPTEADLTLADEDVDGDGEFAAGDDLIAGDSSELTPAIIFGTIFGGIWLLGLLLAHLSRKRWERGWPVYLLITPISALVLWNCFAHLDRYLPAY